MKTDTASDPNVPSRRRWPRRLLRVLNTHALAFCAGAVACLAVVTAWDLLDGPPPVAASSPQPTAAQALGAADRQAAARRAQVRPRQARARQLAQQQRDANASGPARQQQRRDPFEELRRIEEINRRNRQRLPGQSAPGPRPPSAPPQPTGPRWP
jgi:hypothetical protein